MRKVRLYVYPDATPHGHDTTYVAEYVNTVPFSRQGIAIWAEQVGPDEAEFFYMGQFHYGDTLRDGFRLERFPYLSKCPENHIADIEGDWDHTQLDSAFWDCLLTATCHSKNPSLPNKHPMFVRPPGSRLLMSLLSRWDLCPFVAQRIAFGFRGCFHNHWIRYLLAGYFQKWGLPSSLQYVTFGFGDTKPTSIETLEYERFMAQFGLALCPRGAGVANRIGDYSIRFYEACFYNCVPIIIGNHGILGDDYYDTSFLYRISHEASEKDFLNFFIGILNTPFEELRKKAQAARRYFDEVVRPYFIDPTAFYLSFLLRNGLLKE